MYAHLLQPACSAVLPPQDAEFVALYHSIFPDLSAPAKVPILVDGDVKLVESAVIVGERAGSCTAEFQQRCMAGCSDALSPCLLHQTT